MNYEIILIDLELGNMQSLCSAINFLGLDYTISNKRKELEKATHIILPGVGAFDSAMKKIEGCNLKNLLNEYILIRKKPVLGICLGMQIMFESSEEGQLPGLGFFKSHLGKMNSNENAGIKIPHVGFNSIYGHSETGVFNGIGVNSFFYFTHSYAVMKLDRRMNVAMTNHGQEIVSAFQHENICGVQFHPEKSQSIGLKLLSNFFRI